MKPKEIREFETARRVMTEAKQTDNRRQARRCRASRMLFGALLAASLAGCSSIPPRTRSESPAAADFQPASGNEHPISAPDVPRELPSFSLLNYDLHNEDQGSFWLVANRPSPLSEAGQTDSSTQPPAEGASESESLFSKAYLQRIGSDIRETFTAPSHWEPQDWLVFGGVTAGIGVVAVFDEDIQRAVQRNRNRTTSDIFNAVEPFGAEYCAGILGAFYVGGEIFKDQRAKSVALDGLSASIIASVIIDLPLKYTIGRSRPNKGKGAYDFRPFSGNDSFPSGHSVEAFAVATAIAEHYDSLWIALTSYGVAGAVGYARINSDSHWASDVLAGAAIGAFVSHVVVHSHLRGRNFSLAPIVDPHLKGAQITWFF